MEIYNAKIHHLKYTQYEYTLDFNDFVYDQDDQRATVHLAEGYNVVFEISEMISKNDPIVSKMRNLQHMITLKKYEDEWKIVSDIYDDNLWRLLRETNISKDELLTMIDDLSDQKSDPSPMEYPTTWCNLPYDESSHSYNREGAVAYAHQYAENPNPAYYYFPDTDCTNFINQAIHHGSNAEEVGSDTYGWYYNYYNTYEDNDYSASWSDVQFQYDFITQYYYWDKGPEGCVINYDYAAFIGDIVQFEWHGDSIWDHGAIIVRKETSPDDPYHPYFWISQHSDDLDDHPLNSVIYQDIRFIRIERIDGYAKVYLSLIMNSGGGTTANQPQPITQDSYPASMDEGEIPEIISPYPAP
jgi:hypothetical protein